ncbi:MAG: hypothetical protein JKY08_10935 [Flavobacteriaceae bacterium]|nr:hypothetical protein [Flavobacteriaceae bacterium]
MKLTTQEQFTSNFELELDINSESNKSKIIKNEINEIEKFLEPKEYPKVDKKYRYANLNLKPNHVFKLSINKNYRNHFINAFHDFNLRNEINENENSDIQVVIVQAREFVKYYNWLTELTSENKNVKIKKSSLTHSQKILALYYLGIDMTKYQNNVQSAKVLASILDLDESNTKDYLTYFDGKKSKVKNKKNIEKISELFNHQDFKSILNKIEEEI